MKEKRISATLQEKNGRFYIVARIPTPIGQYRQKWISTGLPVAGNKRKAKQMLDSKLIELQEQLDEQQRRAGWAVADVGAVPFVALIDRWLRRKRLELAPTTIEGYERILVRLRPYFARLNLVTNAVSPAVIEGYVDFLIKEGLSANTVRHHLTLLKSVFNDEIRNGAPILNPVKCVKAPKNETFEANTYTIDEVGALFDLFRGDPLDDIVQIAVLYGLRRSEILGLRWSDIDFDRQVFHVRHKVVQVKVDGVWQLIRSNDLKTEASRRSFPLSDAMRERLLARKAAAEARRAEDEGYSDTDAAYVFVDQNGVLLWPNYVTDHFRHKMAASTLPKLRFHDLRHTCATILLQNGCSLREIQAYLGHATYMTTTRYAHVDGKSKQHALDLLGEVLLKNTNEEKGVDYE